MKTPIVVSYFTKNTPYEREAKDFIQSCKDLQLPFLVEGVKDLGSWQKNCCIKPSFLLSKLKKLERPLLWVDCDAIIMKDPLSYFQQLDCDFSLRIRQRDDEHKVMSGSIFINNTETSFQILKRWEEECRIQLKNSPKGLQVWDQNCLKKILFDKKTKIKLRMLPRKYCFVFGEALNGLKTEEIVIWHFQASRMYKTMVNQDIEMVPFLNNLSNMELKLLRYRKGFLKEK